MPALQKMRAAGAEVVVREDLYAPLTVWVAYDPNSVPDRKRARARTLELLAEAGVVWALGIAFASEVIMLPDDDDGPESPCPPDLIGQPVLTAHGFVQRVAPRRSPAG